MNFHECWSLMKREKRMKFIATVLRINLFQNRSYGRYDASMIDFKKISDVLCVLLFVLGFVHASDIGLSPPRLELSGEPGETITETVILLTEASVPQQITVETNDWTLDTEGNLLVLPSGSLDVSSADWLAPEVSAFTLAPDSSREFRVSVTIPEDASLNGTYHSMVFFTVLPANADVSGVGVITTTQIGLALYINVSGTQEGQTELVDFFQQDDESVTLAIFNDGNMVVRLGGRVELRDETGNAKYLLEVPDIPVLRESEREVSLPLASEIESGFYVALALIEDSQGNLMVGELPITIP